MVQLIWLSVIFYNDFLTFEILFEGFWTSSKKINESHSIQVEECYRLRGFLDYPFLLLILWEFNFFRQESCRIWNFPYFPPLFRDLRSPTFSSNSIFHFHDFMIFHILHWDFGIFNVFHQYLGIFVFFQILVLILSTYLLSKIPYPKSDIHDVFFRDLKVFLFSMSEFRDSTPIKHPPPHTGITSPDTFNKSEL